MLKSFRAQSIIGKSTSRHLFPYGGLAGHYKWFLHHTLTVNQRLTHLPSNQALNNVLNSSD